MGSFQQKRLKLESIKSHLLSDEVSLEARSSRDYPNPSGVCECCGSDCSRARQFCTKCEGRIDTEEQYYESSGLDGGEGIEDEWPGPDDTDIDDEIGPESLSIFDRKG